MANTTFTGPVISLNGFEASSNNGNTVALTAPASLAADYTLTLPPNDGTNGQVLTTDGSGVTTWTTNGVGTVTSVAVSGGTTGLTTSGGPVTSSGTITFAGTLAVANGGTGQTSYTDGQLLIGNTTGSTLAKATLTAGSGIQVTNGNGSITLAVLLASSTAANLALIANAINTTGKYTGKMVVDLATGLIFTATGATAADVWRASDGTTVATPV